MKTVNILCIESILHVFFYSRIPYNLLILQDRSNESLRERRGTSQSLRDHGFTSPMKAPFCPTVQNSVQLPRAALLEIRVWRTFETSPPQLAFSAKSGHSVANRMKEGHNFGPVANLSIPCCVTMPTCCESKVERRHRSDSGDAASGGRGC